MVFHGDGADSRRQTKVRIVNLWRYRHDPEPIKILVTNRITWEVTRILQVYRYRWDGYGDLSSGRQAAARDGRLSAA